MSVKVPYEPVEYQSHHHCQCDFCNTRRTVNAKKFAISKIIKDRQSLQQQNNCCCSCHTVLASLSLGKEKGPPSFELDDPEHHVNQTALNAKMGRTGLPDGNKYTVATGHTSASHSYSAKTKSKDDEDKEVRDELDRLERLLILEQKARVKSIADAEKLALLQSTGKGPRPRPFDATSETVAERNGTSFQQQHGFQTNPVREADDYAKRSSVTPLSQTGKVRDPNNRDNYASARHLSQQQDVLETSPTPSSGEPSKNAFSTVGRRANFLGPRPEGSGVVWCPIDPGFMASVAEGVGGIGNVDNRDLWKTTLVKGGSVNPSVKSNYSPPSALGNVPPGAKAAIEIQQEQQ